MVWKDLEGVLPKHLGRLVKASLRSSSNRSVLRLEEAFERPNSRRKRVKTMKTMKTDGSNGLIDHPSASIQTN